MLKLQTQAVLPIHKHPGWEQIFVLKGKIRFCDRELSTGDHILTMAGEVHEWIAVEPSEILVCSEKEGVELV